MRLKQFNQILAILDKTLSIAYTILLIMGDIPPSLDPVSLVMVLLQLLVMYPDIQQLSHLPLPMSSSLNRDS